MRYLYITAPLRTFRAGITKLRTQSRSPSTTDENIEPKFVARIAFLSRSPALLLSFLLPKIETVLAKNNRSSFIRETHPKREERIGSLIKKKKKKRSERKRDKSYNKHIYDNFASIRYINI